MTRLRCLLLVAAAGSAAPAQDAGRVRGDSPQTRTRLAEAERKLLGGQPAEAADDLLKLLDDAGDDLVSADGVTYRPARRIAHALLARLPADVLRTVRGRIDGPAARLFEQGRAARDRRPLRLLLDRYFVARPAEDALELLGDLSFERGEFRAAAAAWRALLSDPAADGPTFPDPKHDPAAVRARLALALVFAGDLEAAGAELVALRDKYPAATGRLAGQNGSYVSTLTSLMKAPPRVPPEATPGGDWPAFAGSFARTGRVTDRLPRYWSPSPTWRTPIPAADGPPPGRTVPFAAPARACAFHPVVLGGTAYIADPARVVGFDLRTGRAAVEYEHPTAGVDLALPPAGAADYTLTAADGRVYARLGRPEIPPPADPTGKGGPSSVLVGLAADPETGGLTPLWELPPPAAADGTAVTWEAAPVVARGRIYAAVSRVDGTRLVHAVAAYADPPGRPLWVTDVAESPAAAPRTRPEPLTLAGDVLVFCSHSGVVAAVDAFTGRPAWAHRYRPAPPTAGPGRDLCPAVYADGRVFAAPADAGAVFALDAGTGRPLWEADGIQVDQLLGVSRGRLVVTLGGPVKGIRGLDLATGASVEPRGWRTHDDPQLGSFGRGLASEELILWPTASREGTYLLHASDGTNAGGWQTLREARGNLAYAGGVLVVATPTEVMGYVADRNDLAERQRLAALPGGRAAADLALALGDAGRWGEANAAWAATAEADRRIGENLTDRAERAADRGDVAGAVELFRAAAAAPVSDAVRVRSLARAAALDPGGKPQSDGPDGWVLTTAGRPVRLREYAAAPTAAAQGSVSIGMPFARRRPPADWSPAATTDLAPPIRAAKRVGFPNPRCVPLKPFAGEADLPGLGRGVAEDHRHLVVTDGKAVYAYRPGADRPAWFTDLPAGFSPTHAVADGGQLVLAGPRGAATLRLSDGTLGRPFLMPDTDPLPAAGGVVIPRWSGPPPPAAELTDFVLAGSRLVARLGDHHLVGIDPVAGRVAWLLDGHGRPRFTPSPFATAPGFNPHLGTDGRTVVAQLTTGQRVAVAGDSGRMSDPRPTALLPWSAPPALGPDGGLVVADGPGTLRLLTDPAVGAVGWAADAGAEASQTGRPPAARWLHGSVLTVASSNTGVEVNRLRADGATLWQAGGRGGGGPVLLPAADLDPGAADADDQYVYLPTGGRLTAVVGRSGKPVWGVDLAALVGPDAGGTPWAVRAGRRAVFAYPTAAIPFDRPADVFTRAAGRFFDRPSVDRLPTVAAGLYDAWAARSVPVVVLDPDTGTPRQRLDLPAAGPAVAVHLGPDAAVVATAGAAYWLE